MIVLYNFNLKRLHFHKYLILSYLISAYLCMTTKAMQFEITYQQSIKTKVALSALVPSMGNLFQYYQLNVHLTSASDHASHFNTAHKWNVEAGRQAGRIIRASTMFPCSKNDHHRCLPLSEHSFEHWSALPSTCEVWHWISDCQSARHHQEKAADR